MLRVGRTFYGIKLNGFESDYYVWCIILDKGTCVWKFSYIYILFYKGKKILRYLYWKLITFKDHSNFNCMWYLSLKVRER